MNPERHLITFLSFYPQKEVREGSGPFQKNVVMSLRPTETPRHPAHAAAPSAETASFCLRIVHEDFATATDVLGPTSLHFDAQRSSAARGWGRT